MEQTSNFYQEDNLKKYLEEEILPIIKQETDWFDKWICNKYKLPARRKGYGVVKDQQFKNILTRAKDGKLSSFFSIFSNNFSIVAKRTSNSTRGTNTSIFCDSGICELVFSTCS